MNDWIPTKEMAQELDVSIASLLRLKGTGFLKHKKHYIQRNPESTRGPMLWHKTRTTMAMFRI